MNMANLIFITATALLISLLYAWGFHVLQKERWQMLGAIPTAKRPDGRWQGVNLTYYGLFNANAYTLGVLLVFVLLGAAGWSLTGAMALVGSVLAVCIPSSSLVARWVEKKRFTFSIGGASFVGILITPLASLCVLRALGEGAGAGASMVSALAAVSIAYTLGEGTGRLACISFGCCYGKPLDALPSWAQKMLTDRCFVYTGKTKKISYASGLDERKIVPVQGITAVVYAFGALAGLLLFFNGWFRAAFWLTLTVTQLWRFASEFLRADYRGDRKISCYQIMSLFAVIAGSVLAVALPSSWLPLPNVAEGFRSVWSPGMILFLQALWIFAFLYTGRSQVTEAVLSFQVRKDRI